MSKVEAVPPDLTKKALWISWEKHRRSQSLAARLGVPLIEFESSKKRWLKHPLFVVKTLALLLRERPGLLFVQNPSVVLTLLAIFCKPFFQYRLIVDAHNAGIYPFEKGHEKYSFLFPFMHNKADVTIVTNKLLADIVEKNNGTPVVLPDPLPEFPVFPDVKRDESHFIVTYICSYASDEPYKEVFKAAAMLPEDVKIVVTGDYSKLTDEDVELALKNSVVFTGFLSDDDYLKQLIASDCIMVLTEYNDCMVCGAYEAVSLEKPLILSDTPVLRWWFTQGVMFNDNTAFSIKESVLDVQSDCVGMGCKIKELKTLLPEKWHSLFYLFEQILPP